MLTDVVEFPRDPVLGDWHARLDPVNVLVSCRENLQRVAPELRRSWRACRRLEALYHPGRQLQAAYVLLADPDAPPERQWPEGQIVYLRAPVRRPISGRGELLQLDGGEVEAYSFPNDRRLRGIREFAGKASASAAWQSWIDASSADFTIDPESLQRLLMRYVPEQKWIIRLRAEGRAGANAPIRKRRIAVRCTSTTACVALERRHRLFSRNAREQGAAFVIPDVVGCEPSAGLLATEWLRGESLVEALSTGCPHDLMLRVAQALHGFQNMHIHAVGRTAATPDSLAARVRAAAEDLALAYPEARADWLGVADDFAVAAKELAPAPPVTLHNDFHWNQVTIKSDRVVLLDLERVGRGDSLIDVANFVTQIRMLPLRGEAGLSGKAAENIASAFFGAWERVAGGPADPYRMRLYSTLSLAELARGMMRHVRPGARELALACLERCGQALGVTVAGVGR